MNVQWTSQDGSARVGMCQRRTSDRRNYKLIMNAVGNCPDFAIAPKDLKQMAIRLVESLQLDRRPDYILGLSAAGIPIAIAVSFEAAIPAIIAYKFRLDLPNEIAWKEPHCIDDTFYLYGLNAGVSVVILDDEVDSGHTLSNAVIALRAKGVNVYDIGCVVELLRNDVGEGRERLRALGLVLKSVLRIETELKTCEAGA